MEASVGLMAVVVSASYGEDSGLNVDVVIFFKGLVRFVVEGFRVGMAVGLNLIVVVLWVVVMRVAIGFLVGLIVGFVVGLLVVAADIGFLVPTLSAVTIVTFLGL